MERRIDTDVAIAGVYQIINMLTSERYIGSSVNIAARTSNHIGLLRSKRHVKREFQTAWNKYGEQSFKIEILHIIDTAGMHRAKQIDEQLTWEKYHYDKRYAQAGDHEYNGIGMIFRARRWRFPISNPVKMFWLDNNFNISEIEVYPMTQEGAFYLPSPSHPIVPTANILMSDLLWLGVHVFNTYEDARIEAVTRIDSRLARLSAQRKSLA